MKRLRALVLLAAVATLGPASRADASVIGSFSWDVEACGGFDPCFTVYNFSSTLDFLNVSVTAVDESNTEHPLYPGSFVADSNISIAPGESLATLDAPLDTVFARLNLNLAQAGVVRFLDGDGNAQTGLAAPNTSLLIDFEPTETAVPEPGTLLLLGTGAAAQLARRRTAG